MKKGVDYPGVAIVYICHDGQGNFLMQKRGENCRDERGRWDIGGGALEIGDGVIETLKKEVREEYGAEVKEYEFLEYRDARREHDGENLHWIALNFKVLIDPKEVKNGEPHKFDEIGWFTLGDLPSPLHSQLEGCIEKYAEGL